MGTLPTSEFPPDGDVVDDGDDGDGDDGDDGDDIDNGDDDDDASLRPGAWCPSSALH